ncbi:MAG TPA: class I SAM-dependent methyltransferase, partial [Nannocystis exedens]|nr:class I SAM-dependent methyltransferase [Nannocystis exedens]
MSTSSITPSDSITSWWHEFHDDLLVSILLERSDQEQLKRTLDLIVGLLELAPGARVFDQCCGIGSLSRPLAARGFRVVAVDRAQNYIERARREAEREQRLDLRYIAADACDYRLEDPADGAINWWTSFGYAERDEENAEMLARAYESLRPGGVFLLDTMNAAAVLRHFQPAMVTRRAIEGGELVLLRESSIDLPTGALDKRWTYYLPDGRQVVHRTRVRLYQAPELARLLRAVGFVDIE